MLGCLIEKESTTPEYYPLTLNALISACNQKSSRDPVMNLNEETVRGALSGLRELHLGGPSDSAEGRVPKYEHRLQEVFNLNRREIAVLCVLLLRGPQTPGELRGRTERLHEFADLGEVQTTLQWLMKREPPIVKVLPRQSGTKEPRYAHLLCGDVTVPEGDVHKEATASFDAPENASRMERMEIEVEALRNELSDLKQQFADFQKRFE